MEFLDIIEEQFEIGSRHIIWVEPFYEDTLAEVIAMDERGFPVFRTLEGDKSVTLNSSDYTVPTEEEINAVNSIRKHYKEMYGTDL